ncbi:hypothetical protein LTR12_012017 [Friedmanniomyces endolithicus]|nr:hypothetical protein LTR12_012017 [Friedmanniomyces endolithicus]
MANTEDTSTTTGIDYHCDQARELRQALDKVLAHQETLKDTITWPTMACRERFKPEEIRRVKSLIGDIEGLEKVSQRLLPPPTALRMIKESNDRGKAAAKAFKVPEVLEEILLYLSIPDLHQAEDTSRDFRSTVAGSPRLQRKLFRSTASTDPLRSLGYVGPFDLHDPWLGYSMSFFSLLEEPFARHSSTDNHINFKGIFQSSTGKLPPLSERVLEMWLAETPGPRAGPQTIWKMRGWKVRDLYRIAQRLLADHKLCPDAPQVRLNERGFVQDEVCFRGEINKVPHVEGEEFEMTALADDDPAWLPHRERAKMSEALETRLAAYIAAKKTAKENKRPMFTLQEFEARGAEDPADEPLAEA